MSLERNEYDGNESVFGNPRVTRCRKIILAVFKYFLTFQREVTCKTPNLFIISPWRVFVKCSIVITHVLTIII